MSEISANAFAASYPAAPEASKQSRQDMAAWLERQGADDDAVEVARHVLAELFANALEHHRIREGETVGVRLSVAPGLDGLWVQLSVSDAGHGTIGARRVSGAVIVDNDEHGRGLRLVRGLGVRITDERLPHGYRVVARFPTDAEMRARVCRCACGDVWPPHGRWCLPLTFAGGAQDLVGDPDEGSGVAMPMCIICKHFATQSSTGFVTSYEESVSYVSR